MSEPRKISNSEVTTWLSCRQQYEFAFENNLTPKETPTPLARGTLGHLAFQYYIEARLNSSDHELALKGAEKAFEEAPALGVSIDVIMETQFLFNRYMGRHDGWPQWELLGTEEKLEIPITEDIIFPIRYDVFVKEIHSDRNLVGDFKFTYDFWSIDDHSLNGQMPKYIKVLNANGKDVQGGFLEEIRTRPLGKAKSLDVKNLWKTTYYYPSELRQRNFMKQHIAACLEIKEFLDLEEEEREAKRIPVLNKHGACKFCNFKELCSSKLGGKDITYDKEIGFVQNSYGYNKTLDDLRDEL